MKKVLSLFIAVVMIISAMASVTAFAATQEIHKLDLSTYTGNVAEEDGKTAAVIGKKGDAFTIGDAEVTLGDTVAANNSAGLLPEGSKGVVINTTFKLSSTAAQILLTPSDVYPRYIDIVGGVIKHSPASGAGSIPTEISVSAGVWYDMTYMLNYETGYIKLALKNLSDNTIKTYAATNAQYIKTAEQIAAIKKIKWWHTGNKSANMFISKYEVYAENDADAIAPSKVIVRDDFDSATGTVSASWSSTTIPVAQTDRGQSAYFGSSAGTSLTCSKSGSIINTSAKGIVIEFAAKLGYTSTKPNFVVSAKGNWYNGGSKLMQFHNNANGVTRDGQSGDTILSSWKKDTWYDVRLEIAFKEAGLATYRYIINDGTNEYVKVFDNVSTTLFDDLSAFSKIQFTYASGDDKAYVDDVNIFWLDEAAANGITSGKDTVSVNNRFENFDLGSDDITADMTCGAPTSFWYVSGGCKADFSIEEVPNSGRGKSFKATASNMVVGKNEAFYKDFAAIQNGVVSFDIMFTSQKGLTLITAQASEANNANTSNVVIFRFDNWGNIKDGSNKNVIGSYEPNKWYKVVLTSGIYNEVSGVKYQIYSASGLAAEGVTVTNSDDICRDSIRYARISMHDYDNTLYVDNYKAYAPSATPYGIYPVAQSVVKGSTLTPENKIMLTFSKFVDLSKSTFKVNGEPVTASGTDVIALSAAIEEGETYDVEYTVYDLDGYKAYGYVNNITVEAVYNVSDYSQATLDNPAASADVRIGEGAGTKEVILLVAAYNGDKLVSANLLKQTVDSLGDDFTVAVDANGADSIKTFLWNGKNLMPIK